MAAAEASGITDKVELAAIKSQAYFGLHYLDVMAILFVLNILIMLLIGRFRPRREDYVQVYTKQVDITPWKMAKPVGLGVVIVVAAIYAYFA
jgi:SSS family solute:Na+ symporter